MEGLLIQDRIKPQDDPKEVDRMDALVAQDFKDTHTSWYPRRSYTAQYTNQHGKMSRTFNTVGMITGCGIIQGYGISSFADPNAVGAKEAFVNQIIPQMEADMRITNYGMEGSNHYRRLPGALVVTLGGHYWPQMEKTMFEMGFILAGEYPNYQHYVDGRETQRMYMYKFKKPG